MRTSRDIGDGSSAGGGGVDGCGSGVPQFSQKFESPVIVEGDGYVFRGTVWGAMRAEIATFDKEFDEALLLKGLPGGMSPTPGCGYILKGRCQVTVKVLSKKSCHIQMT